MVRTLDYNAGLSLAEAEDRFEEVKTEFKNIRDHYSGVKGIFKKRLSEEDKKSLSACVNVLSPLGLEGSVLQQSQETNSSVNTLFYQINQLYGQIVTYSLRFKNSGIFRMQEI